MQAQGGNGWGGFVQKFLFLFFILICPSLALSAEPAAPTPITPEKIKIGSSVDEFNQTATSSAKAGMYFLAGILIIFGVWKKINEKKFSGQQKLISIVSKTSIGPRAGLLIAEVEGERFLLSQTPERISFITKLNNGGFENVLEEELSDETA